jgi:hypothetical protein
MMKTNYRTWTTSELVTATMLNEQIRDNGNEIWQGIAAGDMDYYTSSTTKTRLPIGNNYDVLMVQDGVPVWRNAPACALRRSTNLSIPNGIETAITGYTASFEYGGEFYASGSQIIVPQTGWYVLRVGGYFVGHSSAGTLRQLSIFYLPTNWALCTQSTVQDNASSATHLTTTVVYGFTAGDTLEVRTLQRSGGVLDIDEIWFSMVRVR